MNINNYLLGIEYKEERIKCSILKRNTKTYELYALQSFEATNINSSLEALARWKTENLGETPVKAIVSLSESLIFFKELTVPNAKKAALNEAIYWELAENSPIPADEAIYEWTELSSNKSEVKVSAMAIRESVVIQITNKLEEAGVEIIAFEPSSVSLARSTSADYSKTTMVLMVGQNETDIVVLKAGNPVFSTTADVTLGRSKDGKWKLDEKVGGQIAEKTKGLIEFWDQKSEDKIQQVIITGDLVDKYFGLAQLINDFAKIPVNIARQKKIAGISFGELAKAVVNRYFISIGAVSRFMMDDVYGDVNLISRDKKDKITQDLKEKLNYTRLSGLNRYLAIFVVILLITGATFFGLSMGYKTSLSNVRQMISSHPGQGFIADTIKTNDYLNKIKLLSGKNMDLGKNYSVISALTPNEIRLTKIQYNNSTNQEWIITGTGSREAILAFYSKLKDQSGAKVVTMPYSNLNKDTENEFEVNILW